MEVRDELKRLEADLEADEALKARFANAVQRALEVDAQSEGEAMTVVANEFGYDVTAADIDRWCADAEQIDLDDLENVAGGFLGLSRDAEDGHEAWCLATYYCYTVMAHSGSKIKEGACWSDYICISASHH